MTSAFSWQNSVSLCHASFCTPRPSLPVIPGVSFLQTSNASLSAAVWVTQVRAAGIGRTLFGDELTALGLGPFPR